MSNRRFFTELDVEGGQRFKDNKLRTIALVGQPNMGKSTLFNLLTGLNQHVGNWPGKTVEQKSGVFSFNGKQFNLIDLPGTYSLTANSPEEVIAREFIITQKPDVVIAVISAAILERSLYLVSELVCLPAPVVVALNMIDVAEQQGMMVDADALSKALNLPVIPIVATKAQGVRDLIGKAINVISDSEEASSPNIPRIRADVSIAIEQVELLISDYVPDRYLFRKVGPHIHRHLHNNALISNQGLHGFGNRHHIHAGGEQKCTNRGLHKGHFHNHHSYTEQISDQSDRAFFRYHETGRRTRRDYAKGYWIALKLIEGDTEITKMMKEFLPPQVWQKVDEILRQNDDAMVAVASGRYTWIGGVVKKSVQRPKMGQIGVTERLDRIATHPVWGLVLLALILGFVFWLTFALGAPLQEWLEANLVTRTADWLRTALAGAPVWVSGLLADGVVQGVGSVITFLPILIIFFASFGFLEDIGYMARAAYVMDNIMHLMGLHGKSFLPLFLGFGCNVPAVMGTRVIDSWPARLLTILIAPLVPCTARMAVIAFLAPAFFGANAIFISWGIVLLSLVLLVLLGILLNKLIFKGERSAFIMEMPLYHIPNLRTVGLLVWQRSLSFIKKAGTVILAVSALIWALSYFPGGDLNSSYLAIAGKFLEPAGEFLGFDWRLTVALLTSFPAKENAVATLGVLFGGSENLGLTQVLAATYSSATALSFLVVTMLFIPCVATIAVIKQETESWKWPLISMVMYMVLSICAGALVYHVALAMGV